MFEESFTGTQLAHALCNNLVKAGKLKEKPAFIRTDREAKMAGYFESGGLDGAKMSSFDNPGAVEMLVRRITNSEPWVDDAVEALVAMLPESAAKAKKVMGMDEETKAALEEAQDRTAQRRERLEEQKDAGRDDRGGGRRDRDDDRDEPRGGGRWGDKGYGGRDDDRMDRGGDRWGDEPKKEKGAGKGKRDRGERLCSNCKQPGHMSRDCPEPVDEEAVRERLAAKAAKDAKDAERREKKAAAAAGGDGGERDD